jgi:hypothetical protein
MLRFMFDEQIDATRKHVSPSAPDSPPEEALATR